MDKETRKSYQREVDRVTKQSTKSGTPNVPEAKSIRRKATEPLTKPRAKALPEAIPTMPKGKTNVEPPKVNKVKQNNVNLKPPRVKTAEEFNEIKPRIRHKKEDEEKELLSAEERSRIRSEAAKKAWKTRLENMTPEEREQFGRDFAERMAKSRKNTTPEQRSKRAKKAWQTKLSNMSPQERELFGKEFAVRMEDAREAKAKQEADDYPVISIIDRTRDKLANIDNVVQQPDEGNEDVEYVDGTSLSLRDSIENLERSPDVPEIPLEVRKNELLRIFDETVEEHKNNGTLGEYIQYLEEHASQINDQLDTIRYYYSFISEKMYQTVDSAFTQLATLLANRPLSSMEAESLSIMSEYSQVY